MDPQSYPFLNSLNFNPPVLMCPVLSFPQAHYVEVHPFPSDLSFFILIISFTVLPPYILYNLLHITSDEINEVIIQYLF